MCIPEKIHNLIVNTKNYGNVDNRNIEKIQEIDSYQIFFNTASNIFFYIIRIRKFS